MKETLKKMRQVLRPLYGERETEAMIRLIFHHIKGWNLTDMVIHEGDALSDFSKQEIDEILERLSNHEPLQYIIGEARFHGLDFKVDRNVLVPRPETSELIDLILKDYGERADLKVIDLCTGSGCIAISLYRHLRFPQVYALDYSIKALDLAKYNAEKLKAKVNFIHRDIFDFKPTELFDIIVSNPPYVLESEKTTMHPNVLNHEPHDALFVPDEAALKFYNRIADIAKGSLKEDGKVYMEVNPKKAEDVATLFSSKGFDETEVVLDSYGKQRFVIASWH